MPALRVSLTGALAVLVVILAGCQSVALTPSQGKALTALNHNRTANNRRAVPDRSDAQRKAQGWADKLARENALYHSKLTDGIQSSWCALGENVGYGATIASIENASMHSSGHRANILSARYNGAGVGVTRNGSRLWVVQEFIQNC